MSSPQVEGMTLDGLEVMEDVEQGNKKKEKEPARKKATCNACHIAGHSSNNSKEEASGARKTPQQQMSLIPVEQRKPPAKVVVV